MSTIKIKVVDQQLVFINRPVIASGGINEDYINFDFSEEWDGFAKIAIFYKYGEEEKYLSAIAEYGTCLIPYELTITPGKIYFGVIGGTQDRTIIYTSELAEYEVEQGAYKVDELEISDPETYASQAKLIVPEDTDPDLIYYSVRRNFNSNVTSNRTVYRVMEHVSYVEELTYEGLLNCMVEMGGVNITSQVLNNGVITIPDVTGNIVITANAEGERARYSVTRNLTHVTADNSINEVAIHGFYNVTLSAELGYTIDSVIVTMGGVEIYSGDINYINIADVTGDIVITAVATEHIIPTAYITRNLTGCTSNKNDTEVVIGEPWNEIITPNDPSWRTNSFTLRMNNEDITSSILFYDANSNRCNFNQAAYAVIDFSQVTGDIYISMTFRSTS